MRNKQPKKKKVNFNLNSLCPCGEGLPAFLCCGLPTGKFWRKPPVLMPPLPVTGYSHPGCYLQKTLNCSKELSAEHFMSKSILEQISLRGPGGGAFINVDGFAWVPPGESMDIGVSSLTAKILCRRHNTALSPLDTEASRFFSRMNESIIKPPLKSLSRKGYVTLTSGDAFEKWVLKVACGMFYSKNARKDGKTLIEDHDIDEDLVCSLLSAGSSLTEPCGLYVRQKTNSSFKFKEAIGMTSLSHVSGDSLVGFQICLFGGLEFQLIFDLRGIHLDQILSEGWIYRPSEIAIWTGRRVDGHHISWPENTPKASISLTRWRPGSNLYDS